jgi:predicted HNH restriction endonuclease
MITKEQYQKALKALTPEQRNFLIKLSQIEPVSDSNEIAFTFGYKKWGAANLRIGTIGKAICQILKIKPDLSDYNPTLEKGYFIVIHRQYTKPYIHWNMEPNLREAIITDYAIEAEKADSIDNLPTEVSLYESEFPEGLVTQVLVNRYERSRSARQAALKIHGHKCVGCQIDFKRVYGSDIDEIIQVHHIVPLQTYSDLRKTDPEVDLFPLCPNCHSVVHSTSPIMSIEELKARVQRNRC